MCRLFGVQAERPVVTGPWIRAFAERCRESREYQGHGWGVAWWNGAEWERYRSLLPIWEDDFEPPAAVSVIVHARSAFRNEGIEIENNMPFIEDGSAFAFNGELHGVRLSVPGATGAARLDHLYRKFRDAADGDALAALTRLDGVVARRSERVRALNVVAAGGPELVLNTRFAEDEVDYFTMYTADLPGQPARMVTSERVSVGGIEPAWVSLPNGSTCALVAEGVA